MARVKVFLDAVGTLIYPRPAVAEAYADVAGRWGIDIAPEEAERRFRLAFSKQDQLDKQGGYRTSEKRERERWEQIVQEVFGESNLDDGLMNELWQHFAQPSAWALFPDATETLRKLDHLGVAFGIASNFDSRLRSIVAGLPPLELNLALVISSEVGWRKPAAGFFESMCDGMQPGELLYIGDDPVNDGEGARNAGIPTIIIDREKEVNHPDTIRSLHELPEPLRDRGYI